MDGIEGVIAAIEYAQRRKAQRAPAPAQPAAAQAPLPPPVVVRPAAPAAAPAAPPQAPTPTVSPHHSPQAGPLQSMFEDGNSLLKAIVASEVLGPPAALREHHLWNRSPNEPST